MQRAKNLNLWSLCAIAWLLTLAPGAMAGEGCALDQTSAAEAETVAPATVPTAGMRVVIDPETGALRAPTAEESAVLFGIPEGQPPTKSEAQEPAIERPDGSLLLQFRGSFLKAAVATVGDDGEVAVEYHAESVPMPAHRIVNPPAAAAAQATEAATEATTEEKE